MAVMQYYNPTDDVFNGRVGRKLADTGEVPRPFEHYFSQLREGEIMYAGIRGGLTPPEVVAYAHTEASYQETYARYFSGAFMDFSVFALPASAVQE